MERLSGGRQARPPASRRVPCTRADGSGAGAIGMYHRLAGDERVEVALVHQLVDQTVAGPAPATATYWSNFGVTRNPAPWSEFLEPKDA